MLIQILIALLAAFLVSVGFGKWLVPWLKKKEFEQPLKDEVLNKVYTDGEGEASDED